MFSWWPFCLILLTLPQVSYFFPSKVLLNESKSFLKSKILSHLFMKQDSVFCFSHAEISQTTMLHATLFVQLESSQWVGVHWDGLRLFGATVRTLLIIIPFSQWKLTKIETENCIGIWKDSWCCWKALRQLRVNRVYFRPKVWKILIF